MNSYLNNVDYELSITFHTWLLFTNKNGDYVHSSEFNLYHFEGPRQLLQNDFEGYSLAYDTHIHITSRFTPIYNIDVPRVCKNVSFMKWYSAALWMVSSEAPDTWQDSAADSHVTASGWNKRRYKIPPQYTSMTSWVPFINSGVFLANGNAPTRGISMLHIWLLRAA